VPKPTSDGQPKSARRSTTAGRRRFADAAARWLVSAGGLVIIASILGILFFIVVEVIPLFRSARVEPGLVAKCPGASLGAVMGDEYRTLWLALGMDGRALTGPLDAPLTGKEIAVPGFAPAPLRRVKLLGDGKGFAASTDDGRLLAIPARFDVSFGGGSRSVTPVLGKAARVELDPNKNPIDVFAVSIADDGAVAFAAALPESIALARLRRETNALSGESTEEWQKSALPSPGALTSLIIDHEGRNLYGGTSAGQLVWWDLSKEGSPPQVVPAGISPVTAIGFLLGDRAVVAGQADGSLAVWFPVARPGSEHQLTRIREFPAMPGPIRSIAAARRDKGFVAQDDSGTLGLYYSTSGRVLWTGPSPIPRARSIFYSPKGDGLLIAGERELASVALDNPHPEFSLSAIFGKVWYEGLPEPSHTWASTGGTDDYEAKLSLTPLLFGTLKGTFYSLLLAIPIAVLAAMYTSQFLHPTLRRIVKPVVEIMAALPSVVLGFLAALWLAPRLERWFPALLLLLILVPASIVGAGFASRLMPRSFRHRFPDGAEVFAFVGVLAIAFALALSLAAPVEHALFGGNFTTWLLSTTGQTYQQRNAVVVGLAMGFAVIPIIFAISEDAFSNVPRSLVSGSLALGANRWQTVTRVVLPTASPGIFSAIMIGFGRAVGETMIVLLAAGNTAIMTLSPFDGFRTLSANIATEITDAVPGSTHFRTLFLAALLLFALTFVVNTVAELVRQRLRSKYSNL
jgi:phosphate transport system permease protein